MDVDEPVCQAATTKNSVEPDLSFTTKQSLIQHTLLGLTSSGWRPYLLVLVVNVASK
jgi:hypothetical protein